jgi:hypothetical protein
MARACTGASLRKRVHQRGDGGMRSEDQQGAGVEQGLDDGTDQAVGMLSLGATRDLVRDTCREQDGWGGASSGGARAGGAAAAEAEGLGMVIATRCWVDLRGMRWAERRIPPGPGPVRGGARPDQL